MAEEEAKAQHEAPAAEPNPEVAPNGGAAGEQAASPAAAGRVARERKSQVFFKPEVKEKEEFVIKPVSPVNHIDHGARSIDYLKHSITPQAWYEAFS